MYLEITNVKNGVCEYAIHGLTAKQLDIMITALRQHNTSLDKLFSILENNKTMTFDDAMVLVSH